MKNKTVTEKINELLKSRDSSDEDSDGQIDKSTAPKVVDFDEYELPNNRSTEFRKKNVKLLSEQSARYKGKITSRKELQDDDEDELEDSDSDDSGNLSENELLGNDSDSEDVVDMEENETLEGVNSGSDIDDEDDDASASDEDDETEEEYDADAPTDVITESNRQAEIQKGVCVQNQLHIWERMLEFRIHTQKMLTKANELPAPTAENKNYFQSDIARETAEKTCLLLKSMLDLKNALTAQFSEMRTNLKRPSKVLSSYVSGGEPPLKRIGIELAEQHKQFHTYRNTVLLKWDDRTKLLLPGAGSKRKVQEEYDIIRKIDNALLNKDTLIAKSRKLQNENTITGNDSNAMQESNETATTENPNIYDDKDFYYQQLRELIEYKTSTSTNLSEVSKQMAELQKIRQKMKKKVDTRASKGRKIRYIVHNKLINFMAPDDTSSANWTDEAKDELYKSLFAT